MKVKELVQLAVALIIFAIAGLLIYMQAKPKSVQTGKNRPMVEVVTPLPASFNQQALDMLDDTNNFRDFYIAPDLNNGLGNTQIFGPLR